MCDHPDPLDREAARNRLALALDLSDLDTARRLAGSLIDSFGIVKVGLELYAAAGPAAVEAFVADGFSVFVDLKLHDIPTTVGRAARTVGALGAAYLTVHTAGGMAMLEAAREGLAAGASRADAIVLGVTVLTSEANPAPGLLAERAGLAASAGLGGLVCAAPDLPTVSAAAPGLVRVVPGTRLAGDSHDDQARVATPAEAVAAGADVLVIGRSVTSASDPKAATAALYDALGVA